MRNQEMMFRLHQPGTASIPSSQEAQMFFSDVTGLNSCSDCHISSSDRLSFGLVYSSSSSRDVGTENTGVAMGSTWADVDEDPAQDSRMPADLFLSLTEELAWNPYLARSREAQSAGSNNHL